MADKVHRSGTEENLIYIYVMFVQVHVRVHVRVHVMRAMKYYLMASIMIEAKMMIDVVESLKVCQVPITIEDVGIDRHSNDTV